MSLANTGGTIPRILGKLCQVVSTLFYSYH